MRAPDDDVQGMGSLRGSWIDAADLDSPPGFSACDVTTRRATCLRRAVPIRATGTRCRNDGIAHASERWPFRRVAGHTNMRNTSLEGAGKAAPFRMWCTCGVLEATSGERCASKDLCVMAVGGLRPRSASARA